MLPDPWDAFHRGGAAPLLRHLPPPAAAPQATLSSPPAGAATPPMPASGTADLTPGPGRVPARMHHPRPVRVDVLAAVREKPELVEQAIAGGHPGVPARPGELGARFDGIGGAQFAGTGAGEAPTAPATSAHPRLPALLRRSGILQGLTPEMRDDLRSQLEQVENLQELRDLFESQGLGAGNPAGG